MASNYSHMFPGVLREGKPFNRAVTIFDDFLGEGGGEPNATDDAALWDLLGASAAAAFTAGHGGLVTITENSTTETGIATNVACIRPKAGRRIIFEARLTFNDTGNTTDAFVGLANDTDTPNASGAADDYIGFFFTTAGGNWSAGICKNGSAAVPGSKTAATSSSAGETDVAIASSAPTQGTHQVLRIEVDGLNKAKFFIDGVYKKTLTVLESGGTYYNIPDDVDLRPVIAFIGNADTITLDYILCVSDR